MALYMVSAAMSVGTFQTPNLHDQCNRLDRPLASAEMDYRVPDDGHLISIVELDIRDHFLVQMILEQGGFRDQIKIQVIINTKFDGSNYRFQKFTCSDLFRESGIY